MISMTLTGGTAVFMGFFIVAVIIALFLSVIGLIMRLDGSYKQL